MLYQWKSWTHQENITWTKWVKSNQYSLSICLLHYYICLLHWQIFFIMSNVKRLKSSEELPWQITILDFLWNTRVIRWSHNLCKGNKIARKLPHLVLKKNFFISLRQEIEPNILFPCCMLYCKITFLLSYEL